MKYCYVHTSSQLTGSMFRSPEGHTPANDLSLADGFQDRTSPCRCYNSKPQESECLIRSEAVLLSASVGKTKIFGIVFADFRITESLVKAFPQLRSHSFSEVLNVSQLIRHEKFRPDVPPHFLCYFAPPCDVLRPISPLTPPTVSPFQYPDISVLKSDAPL